MTDNSRNNKRIAKNTLMLYFRMILIMCISLYTSRVVLDALGAADYGIYNVVGGFVGMFTMISGALTTATQRFLSFEIGKGEKGNVKSVFSTAVIIHIVLSVIILIIAETVGVWFLNAYMNFPPDRYVAANWVFQFSLATFLINVISVPYNAALIAYERMSAFAYVSIVEAVLKLLIVFLIVISSVDKLVIYAALLASVAILIRIIYGIYCSRNFKDCRCNWHWDKQFGKNVMSFVSWNLIGSLASVAKEQGINVLLNIFFGATVNAARGVAYQVLSAMNGFVTNFQLAMNPQIVKSYAANEKDNMFKIVFRGSKLSFLMIMTLSMPIMIEAPYILGLWLKEVPNHTTVFLRLVLLTAIVDALSGTLITAMHASGKVRDYQIVVGGISLLTLPIAYCVLKTGVQPYYAMIVGLFMAVVCHLARLLLLKRTINLPYKEFLKQVTLKVILISGLSAVLPLLVYKLLPVNFLTFIAVCVLSLTSACSFSFCIGLSLNERKFVLDKIRSIKNKFHSHS